MVLRLGIWPKTYWCESAHGRSPSYARCFGSVGSQGRNIDAYETHGPLAGGAIHVNGRWATASSHAPGNIQRGMERSGDHPARRCHQCLVSGAKSMESFMLGDVQPCMQREEEEEGGHSAMLDSATVLNGRMSLCLPTRRSSVMH